MAKQKKVATKKEEDQVEAARKEAERLQKAIRAAEEDGDGKKASRLRIERDALLEQIAPR